MITLYGFGNIFEGGKGETKDLRVQWAFEETGLPYRFHALDQTKGDLESEAYQRISPFRQAPVIDDDGFIVAESAAIVLYIAEKAGKLIPKDAQGRTRVTQWCFAATSTVEHTERRWKKDGGASATLTTDVDGANATMREEHIRERSPGGWIGFASLRWGMSTQEVVGLLTARGYAARAVKALATGPETVQLSASGIEGVASFNQFGLRHLELSGPTTDGAAARAKEIEATLGKPASVESSIKTRHADHARMTAIDVEVAEKQPANELTVTETYRPKN